MVRLQVFDPPMCCPTGVCGPTVDPQLTRFAADLEWLKTQGVAVARFNLAQQAQAFAQDPEVRAALEAAGDKALPLIKVDGHIVSQGAYPARSVLAAWAGLGTPSPSLYTEAVQELVAIGAAIASNCEPCFKFHFDKARKLGVSAEDMHRAVRTAQGVKEAPAQAVLALAERYLAQPARPAQDRIEDAGAHLLPSTGSIGCCGGGSTGGSCC